MLHKTVATTVTDTDKGEFSALAATWSVDRQNEQIVKGAFAQTIARWQARARQVPVHWDHQGEAANVIGGIDPSSMVERADGLFVEGKIDIKESDVAREAWRSMKANRVALSFGFMTVDSIKRADGVRELREVDLFEVSIVPAPANEDTRLLSLKSADDHDLPSEADQRRRAARLMLTPEQERELDQWLGVFNEAISGTKATAPATKSKGPIRVARFPVE